MAITGIEPVLDGLVARLVADLPAAINAINATVTDGDTIDRDTPGALQVLDHVPHILTLHTFPTIGVTEGPQVVESDRGYEFELVNELQIVCFMQDADQQGLVRRLRRLRLAVLRTVLHERVVPAASGGGNAAWGVWLRRIEPGPAVGALHAEEAKTWVSASAIVIACHTDEAD